MASFREVVDMHVLIWIFLLCSHSRIRGSTKRPDNAVAVTRISPERVLFLHLCLFVICYTFKGEPNSMTPHFSVCSSCRAAGSPVNPLSSLSTSGGHVRTGVSHRCPRRTNTVVAHNTNDRCATVMHQKDWAVCSSMCLWKFFSTTK